MSTGRLVSMGDACVSVVFDERGDAGANTRCQAIAAAVDQDRVEGIVDVVPGYCAVTVYFNPLRVDRRRLEARLHGLAGNTESVGDSDADPIRIPVEYGAETGPDLASVAEFGGCSEDEVVRLHSETVYRVYMLGFLPGFAYMGPVASRIAMPRHDTPRLRVAAGSVGIAGTQTGIYPCDTPGGWRVIGRARVPVFDLSRDNPFLLRAGDRVRFEAV